MSGGYPVAIVGGGPAGALSAAQLAGGGREVILFDEKLAWEKPCGGGLTHKALRRYPFLAEAERGSIPAECNLVQNCELIAPSGQRVRFRMQHPVAIFSRLVLNGLLLERARRAGVDIRQERVTRMERAGLDWQLTTPQCAYRASSLIVAAGARNSLRARFLPPVSPSDLMLTAGYFIPVRTALMQIQFLKGIAGYIWVFPRPDHVSAGITARMGEITAAELRRTLERWLEDNGFSYDGARFYSHILPSLRAQTFASLQVSGEGWTMIGDSAGLVDPITGEGLYYALRSAELCADALLARQPAQYQRQIEQELLPELKLAARVSERFYHGQIFGESILEQLVTLTTKIASFRDLVGDLFAGIQTYRELRARLYRILPAVMAEGLSATLRLPSRSRGSQFAAGPVR